MKEQEKLTEDEVLRRAKQYHETFGRWPGSEGDDDQKQPLVTDEQILEWAKRRLRRTVE